jgi:hypothetical protein
MRALLALALLTGCASMPVSDSTPAKCAPVPPPDLMNFMNQPGWQIPASQKGAANAGN